MFRCFVAGPEGGKKPYYFRTEAEALDFKKGFESELTTPAGTPNPEEALDKYLSAMKTRGLAESSITTTRHQLSPLVTTLSGMDKVSRSLVVQRLARLTSVASKINTLREVTRFLAFCVKQGWANRNPAVGITVDGRMPTGKPQLTRSEARVLIDYLQKDPSEAATFTLLLLMTGARKSEILHRRVRDVDVAASVDADGRMYGVIEIRRTKTRAGERVLRVYDPALSRLRQQVEGKTFDDYLFPGDQPGKPRGATWPIDHLRQQCIGAGVSVVPPHGLRGTAGSWAKEVGVIGAAISRDLGHNGQGVTNRHYVLPDAGAAARTVQIASSLAPTPTPSKPELVN